MSYNNAGNNYDIINLIHYIYDPFSIVSPIRRKTLIGC